LRGSRCLGVRGFSERKRWGSSTAIAKTFASPLAPVGQIFVDIYALPTTPTTDGFLRDILEKNPHLRL